MLADLTTTLCAGQEAGHRKDGQNKVVYGLRDAL